MYRELLIDDKDSNIQYYLSCSNNKISNNFVINVLHYDVFEISNVHNERNINLKFVILVRIRLNGFSGDCKSKK